MMNQRHLVFGTGLIGGHLAGALIFRGFDTVLLGRAKAQANMADGFIISDYHGNENQISPPTFINDGAPQTAVFDFIWLTVKCTAIEGVVQSLGNFVSPETTIICCQNGLGSDTPLREAFPDNKFITAVVGYNVAELTPGHLHRSTEGKLVIEMSAQTESIVSSLSCDLLPVAGSQNILAEQWAKLQLNLANPVNALADLPVKQMTEDAGYRKIIAALMTELLAVSDAMKLDLPKVTSLPGRWIPRVLRTPNWFFKAVAQKMLAIDPTARTSMWWDLKGNRKTEIDFLNGAVVTQAVALGLHCPVNQGIVDLVHQVESGERKPGCSAKTLADLLLIQ